MEEQNIRINKNQRGQAPTELPFYLQEVKTKHDKQVKRIFQLEMLRQRMNQPSLPKLRGPHSTLRHLGGGKASQESLDQTPTQGQEDQPPGPAVAHTERPAPAPRRLRLAPQHRPGVLPSPLSIFPRPASQGRSKAAQHGSVSGPLLCSS